MVKLQGHFVWNSRWDQHDNQGPSPQILTQEITCKNIKLETLLQYNFDNQQNYEIAYRCASEIYYSLVNQNSRQLESEILEAL